MRSLIAMPGALIAMPGALVAVFLLLVSCGPSGTRPDEPPGPSAAAPLPPVVPEKPAATALRGEKVTERDDGPWHCRVTGAGAQTGGPTEESGELADVEGDAVGDAVGDTVGDTGGGYGVGSGGSVGSAGGVGTGSSYSVGRGAAGRSSGAGEIRTTSAKPVRVHRAHVTVSGRGSSGKGAPPVTTARRTTILKMIGTKGGDDEDLPDVFAESFEGLDGRLDDAFRDMDGVAVGDPSGTGDLDATGAIDETPTVPEVPATERLRASATDDNAEFGLFLEFLAAWAERDGVPSFYRPIDVRERRVLRVVDERGRPVPGAAVHVTDEAADRIVWSGTTYGDGQTPLYPALAGLDTAVGAGLLVEASHDGTRGRTRWDGRSATVEVALDERFEPADTVPVDVLFLLDTTGSMSDEIDRIKETLLRVTAQVRALDRPVDLRYGAILYRDLDDEYLTAQHPFTADVAAFDEALRAVVADGGGDEPESLNQGLHEAVHRMRWRDGAAHVAFLIADAPPHMDYEGDTEYPESARDALAKGIRVHAVAASGLSEGGTVVFRQVAQLTRGQFVFIQYGTAAASAASHGVAGETTSNDLDTILLDRIRAEVEAWGEG